jgi:four helix bundle protein
MADRGHSEGQDRSQAGAAIASYRDLLVWQDAMTLAETCYRVTSAFPREEMFGLTAQIRRAASSVPANIAEGHGRDGTRSFVQFLRISQGSLKELETHVLLAERVSILGSAPCAEVLSRCEELGRMLRSLIRSLERRSAASERG